MLKSFIWSAASVNSASGMPDSGVSDMNNNKIRQIVLSSGEVSSLTGVANTTSTLGTLDGVGSTAKFSGPHGITTDGTNLYVVDTNNHKIRQIVIATGVVSSVTGAVNVASTAGATDGPGAMAKFYYPRGITTDGINLYVVDRANNTIRKIE